MRLIYLKTFVIIPAFLFFVKVSDAQSFLTQDKIWNDYSYNNNYYLYAENGTFLGWTTAEITTWYKVGTDSLIEGKLYKQILSSQDSTMENWQFKAYMREDGNKVYQCYPPSKTEILLYDFGMQPGDTLFDDADRYIATVLKTVRDTVMDKTRKLFIFSKFVYDSDSQEYKDYGMEEAWIEGIGSMAEGGGLFRLLNVVCTGCPQAYYIGYFGLICYFENGELIYHHPDFDKCYYHYICPPPCNSSIPEIKAERGVLTQNTPNPFTHQTEIKFYISDNVNTASLNIYDLQGKQLMQIPITQRGESSHVISGHHFSAGMYLYALIVDGTVVDTKRMILTK